MLRMMHIKLIETETIFLLDLPSVAVSADYQDEAATVKEQNTKYKQVLTLTSYRLQE